MDISIVFTTIIVMGLIVILGALFAYKVNITEDSKQVLISIIINLALPSVILNGVFKTESDDLLIHQVYILFALSIAFHIAALIVALLFTQLFGFKGMFAKKMAILAALGNTGFIGIPLCATIFGPQGGLLAAVFDAGLDLMLFTIVIFMLQPGERFHPRQLKSLFNPPVLAIVAGLIIANTGGTQVPLFVKQLTAILAGLATPLAMLYIGMLLPPLFQQQKVFVYRQIGFPLVIRLLVIPIITMFVMSVTSFEPLIKNLVVILSAMPTVMIVPVIFSRYTNSDEDKAVLTTVYSTLLSLLTLPLVSFFVIWLQLF